MATWDTTDPDTYNRLIIIKKMLRGDHRLLEFLFHPSEAELRGSPSSLLFESGCFSSGEQLLIRVALDIWSCDGDTKLSDLLNGLDSLLFSDILQALHHFRGGQGVQEKRRQLKFPTQDGSCRQLKFPTRKGGFR